MNKHVIGEMSYDIDEGQLLVYNGVDWSPVNQNIMHNYQEMLEGIPIEEIQRFLRKKKLENIKNGD